MAERIHHRGKVLVSGAVALLSGTLALAQTAPAARSSPNIVFVLVDDLGVTDFGCTGSTFYETPNIDRLAKDGVTFTCAYAPCPVCSPSRASLLTGKNPVRTGITDYLGGSAYGRLLPAPYARHLGAGEVTFPKALHDRAHYQTWHVGKWHLGPKGFWPTDFGYDVNVAGYNAGHPSSYFPPYKFPTMTDGPAGEYLTDRLTDESVELIRHRDKSRPFLLSLWHYGVHTPLQAPAPLVAKYREKAHRLGLDTKQALDEGENFPTVQKARQHVMRRRFQSDPTYAAMVESVDASVGRVLRTLEEEHIAGDTLVIVSSDNGGLATAEGSPTCNAPSREGKGWLYEGGLRVPLIVRDPLHPHPGATCASPVTLTDFYPTLLTAAHLPPMPAQHVDATDLTPLLADPSARFDHPDFVWHYPHYGNQGGTPGSVIRSGDLKLIEFDEDHRVELYDLKNDPDESRDLANTVSGTPTAGGLRHRLRAWLGQAGAKNPTPNPDYHSPATRP